MDPESVARETFVGGPEDTTPAPTVARPELPPFPFNVEDAHWFDDAQPGSILEITDNGKCKIQAELGRTGKTFAPDDALALLPIGSTVERNADALFVVLPKVRDFGPIGIGGLGGEGLHAIFQRGWNFISQAPKPE